MNLSWILAAAASCAWTLPATARDPIDRVMAEQIAASDIPGAAIAVIDHGRVTKIAAYGMANLEWSVPVDLDTRFQLASATKIFTGALLMRLVEQGRIGLDDPLTRWFPDAPATWSDITVRQLANHSSGLADRFDGPPGKTVEAIVKQAMMTPLAYAPGSEARYGFTDFTVLRAVLEKASGLSYPGLLQREITGPLNMASTGFAMASDDGRVRSGKVLPRRASIYGWQDGEIVTSDFFFAPQGYGAGGLYSSIRDLAAFFAALDRGHVLTRESIAAIETPATLPAGKTSEFGVGWVVRTYQGNRIVGHSGGPALADIARIEDRQLTVIALSNQQVMYPLLAEQLLDTLISMPSEPARIDADPSLADTLRMVLQAAEKGDPVADYFTSAGSGSVEALASPIARALLRATGPIAKIDYLGTAAGQRRYRIVFARKTMVWRLTPGEGGRLGKLGPE